MESATLHLCRCRMHHRPYPPKNQFRAPDGLLVIVDFDEKDYPYYFLVTNEERRALDWEAETAAFEKVEENLSDIEWEMSYDCNRLPSIDAINSDHFEWKHLNNFWELHTYDCLPLRCRCDNRGNQCGRQRFRNMPEGWE